MAENSSEINHMRTEEDNIEPTDANAHGICDKLEDIRGRTNKVLDPGNVIEIVEQNIVNEACVRTGIRDRSKSLDPSMLRRKNSVNPNFNRKTTFDNLAVEELGVKESDVRNILNKEGGSPLTKEDATWLSWVTKQFLEIAGDDQQIDLDEFKSALGVKKSFFAERFFTLFDEDGGGTIDLSELMNGLVRLTRGSPQEKLKFLFDVFDVDGSGEVDRDELKTVLLSCMEESSLRLTDEVLDKLTDALFESADTDSSGEISFDELVGELKKHPGVMENLTLSAASWLKPPRKKNKGFQIPGAKYFTRNYIINNGKWVGSLGVYLLINIALFVLNVIRYSDRNCWVMIARGCGMCLNWNCTFIVLLMFRYTISWLRTTKATHVLPLDQNVYMHKLIGILIAIFSGVHTVAHLINLGIVVQEAETLQGLYLNATTTNPTDPIPTNQIAFWEYLFTLKSPVGWLIPGFAFLSGVILDVILTVIVICSMPFVRRGGYFQVFYWTHFLYFAFWIFLILHGPIFMYFFAVPGLVYLVERLFRSSLVKRARFGKMHITEISLLPSKVIHLVISRPPNLRYKPGDYIFINIPAIAAHEWHPFTVSSAPEMKDSLWLHIRAVGHWTCKLYEYFEKHEICSYDNTECGLGEIVGSSGNRAEECKVEVRSIGTTKICREEIMFDGPFGTPTREIFETEHAVLIGSGIGVTPFASILQSIMHRFLDARLDCPNCGHWWIGDIPEDIMKLKKVDFIWINRSQNSFEWFLSLLADLESQQESLHEDFLEMQNFITSAAGKNEMKGLGLQMALDIVHEKTGRDVITGLRTKTQPGRPDWDKVFTKISQEKKGKVKVYFCGSTILARTLKEYCEKYKFAFLKENF